MSKDETQFSRLLKKSPFSSINLCFTPSAFITGELPNDKITSSNLIGSLPGQSFQFP